MFMRKCIYAWACVECVSGAYMCAYVCVCVWNVCLAHTLWHSVCVRACVCTYLNILVFVHAYMCELMWAVRLEHKCMYVYVCVYIYIYIYTHTHKKKHALVRLCKCAWACKLFYAWCMACTIRQIHGQFCVFHTKTWCMLHYVVKSADFPAYWLVRILLSCWRMSGSVFFIKLTVSWFLWERFWGVTVHSKIRTKIVE